MAKSAIKANLSSLPPQDSTIEAATLGAILLDPTKGRDRILKLNPHDFVTVRNKAIFEALRGLVLAGQDPEPVKLRSALDGYGQDAPALKKYAGRLPDLTVSAWNFESDLAELKKLTYRRQLMELTQKAREMACDRNQDPAALASDFRDVAQSMFDRISGPQSKLPAIEDSTTMLADNTPEPPELIRGLLHQGTKLVLGGCSKSFKTWTFLDMAASIAAGAPWWNYETRQGRVLYINLEIHRVFFQKRLATVLQARNIEMQQGSLDHWCLRGYAVNFDDLLAEFLQRLKGQGYLLVIIDPVYKLLGNRDENAAGDIASLLNGFERLAVESGAAVAFGAHFSKGNQASKESIDRISGSGVFARDPDSILTMTRHEEDGAFVVEPVLRNLPPVQPFVVRWEYPLMTRTDLDPTRLRQSAGRRREHDPKKLLILIEDTTAENPISISSWAAAGNIKRQTLSDYLPELRRNGWIDTAGEGSAAKQYLTEKGRIFLQEATCRK